jgi:cyanophycinase
LLVMVVTLSTSSLPPAQGRYRHYRIGNPADVDPELSGPAHAFEGGGEDVAAALQWMIDAVRGCSSCDTALDVVVLRASGADDYNEYIAAMNGVDSVDTLIITRRRQAELREVAAIVAAAEVVFFAGGDQCNYVENFKGTALHAAVASVYERGGGVGGKSAGIAIQGEYVYDACSGSQTSERALADPYDRRMSFTYDLFAWRHLEQLITDTHLRQRDRMGRTLVFLARQIQDGRSQRAVALGVDEATAVVVNSLGLATVLGAGSAYVVLADHPPERCERRLPLTYKDFKIWRVPNLAVIDLSSLPHSGFYLRSVIDGRLTEEAY